MQTTSMSITRALATLKAQKLEIQQYFSGKRVFVGLAAGSQTKETNIAGMDKEQLQRHIQSEKDKIDGLIRRQVTIKNTINISNQNTLVTVNGREMSVAEAILLKGTLDYRVQLLSKMRESYKEASSDLNKVQDSVNKRIDALIAAMVTETTTDEKKAEISAEVRKTQSDMLAPILIDPLNIVSAIQKQEEELNFLRTELDYTLSMSNTTTNIDVEM